MGATCNSQKKNLGETPFSLVYGSEVVASTEIVVASYRTKDFDQTSNVVERKADLDVLDEKC